MQATARGICATGRCGGVFRTFFVQKAAQGQPPRAASAHRAGPAHAALFCVGIVNAVAALTLLQRQLFNLGHLIGAEGVIEAGGRIHLNEGAPRQPVITAAILLLAEAAAFVHHTDVLIAAAAVDVVGLLAV